VGKYHSAIRAAGRLYHLQPTGLYRDALDLAEGMVFSQTLRDWRSRVAAWGEESPVGFHCARGVLRVGRRALTHANPRSAEVECAVMDDDTETPSFTVHRVTFGGLIPLARYYNCTRCERDLTDWVMKQSPSEPSSCPNCKVRIGERDIARAQRDTKLGCLWTFVSIAGLVLASAVVVGVVWLLTDPRLLNRFR
jgi:hypothetical protein